MVITEVFDRLRQAGVSIWLDDAGKLFIDADAPEEIKQLIRDHKEELLFYFWSEAKARMLNRIFKEQGKMGEPGRITGATVRDGAAQQWLNGQGLTVGVAVSQRENSVAGNESNACQPPHPSNSERKRASKPRPVGVDPDQESFDFLGVDGETSGFD